MELLKKVVILAAIVVFGICVYSFLLGNEIFQGRFKNDAIGWYFLAKGIFCSLALYLILRILDVVTPKK
ncbi:MAG: hypothetical protein HZC17_04480 [Candidatus Omnitrophica bacterium]|nr:hypothetical protein [Candidatus Omnitrophota bacterium]